MADEEKTFTQDEVNKLIGDARVKAREKAEKVASENIAKERETAASVAKQAKQELETLSEQRSAALEEMAQAMLDDTIKQMGDAAKKAVEALPLVAIEKLKWLRANGKLFQPKGDGVGTPKTQSLGKAKLAPGSVSKHGLRL